jgi:hypothetical protein
MYSGYHASTAIDRRQVEILAGSLHTRTRSNISLPADTGMIPQSRNGSVQEYRFYVTLMNILNKQGFLAY